MACALDREAPQPLATPRLLSAYLSLSAAICGDRLPAKIGRVFMMREWLERETDEICLELGITANNCDVMLYRARMQLRECLDGNWFRGER